MTWSQFNDCMDFLNGSPLLDENGVPLPNDKLWIVTGSHVTKEQMEMATQNWGIEFRTAMIDGKLCTVSGL